MSKLDELMELYGVTSEDIAFETEGLSDEELEAAFENAFAQKNNGSEGGTDPDGGADPDGGVDPNGDGDPDKGAELNSCHIEVCGKTYDFQLSMNDTINALQTLINDTYSENDNTYYSVTVYDKHVIMHDVWFGRAYRQDYKVRKDTYSLVGDRIEVYANYLTKDEEAELERLRASYAELKQFKANIELEAERASKIEILNNVKFDCIRDTEEFKSLVKDVDNYSLHELEIKAKVIFADMADVDTHKSFVGVSHNDDTDVKPYGDLFD